MEWPLFRSAIISSAAVCCGRKRLRLASSSEKRTPWWNQDVKEAIRAKKGAYKALLQNRSALDLQSLHLEVQKSANAAVKQFKTLVIGWTQAISPQTKYFGRPSAVYVVKDQIQQPPLRMLKASW